MSEQIELSKYKKTPIGIIPSDWKIIELKSVLDYEQPGKYLTNNFEDAGSNTIPVLTANKSFILGYTNEEYGVYKNLPVILFDDFTTASRYVDFDFKIKSSAIKLLSAKEDNNLKYLFEKLQLIKIDTKDHKRRWISEYEEKSIALAPIAEQHKIAEIAKTWDSSIEKNENLLHFYKKRRKGLGHKLLSGELRLKEFASSKASLLNNNFPKEWKLQSISGIVDRIKKSFIPIADVLYHEIGIRSHAKGIFHKEGVTGKSLGNKSVFWIEPDCFVVNIVFAWEHAIAKTTAAELGMIASHRFPMYKPKEGILHLDYLLYFFKSAKGKNLLELASPGGAGRNKTLGQSEFLKLQIPVPPIAEQMAIANALSIADNEIKLQQQKIEILKQQKKGLMQRLLAGTIKLN
jgi:type I restriction enzyme S subunit